MCLQGDPFDLSQLARFFICMSRIKLLKQPVFIQGDRAACAKTPVLTSKQKFHFGLACPSQEQAKAELMFWSQQEALHKLLCHPVQEPLLQLSRRIEPLKVIPLGPQIHSSPKNDHINLTLIIIPREQRVSYYSVALYFVIIFWMENPSVSWINIRGNRNSSSLCKTFLLHTGWRIRYGQTYCWHENKSCVSV